MTGQIKYKKTALLFEAFGFAAFVTAIGLALLTVMGKADWKPTIIAGIAFLVFKLTAKLIMTRKSYVGSGRIDPSVAMFDSADGLSMYAEPMDDLFGPTKKQPAQKKMASTSEQKVQKPSSSSTNGDTVVEAAAVPVLKEVVVESNVAASLVTAGPAGADTAPTAQPNKTKKKKPRGPFVEPESEPEPEAKPQTPRRPKAKSKQASASVFDDAMPVKAKPDWPAKPKQFHCNLLSKLPPVEEELNIDESDILCTIDSQKLSLNLYDQYGDEVPLAKIKKSSIKQIEYEEVRDVRTRKQKLLTYSSAGLLIGLFYCVGLYIDEYNASGKLKELSFLITTVLPILAAGSFIGLFIAILIPFKRITYYALFYIQPKQGSPLKIVASVRKFPRLKRLFTRWGFTPLRL